MEKYPSLPEAGSSREAATNVVRRYCGWHIAPKVTEVLTLDGTGGRRLPLPSLAVHSVESLTVDGQLLTADQYTFSRNGWITLRGGVFPPADRVVEVQFTHGFDYAPEVSSIVDSLVQRASMSPAGNVVNQRAGTQSVTFASSGGEVRGMALFESEKEKLAPYRLNAGE